MDLKQTIVVLLLTVALFADVIISRPRTSSSETDIISAETILLEALVGLEQQRTHGASGNHQRHNRNDRPRRHTLTGTMALMETCLKQPARCRELIEKSRRNDVQVIIIEK
ncbi:hypothetical protein CHS0354_018046 [Potamilus streckersoni]|uniref:Secreted protein n=1 Tax=Potamilus streckersoni TaxID=2493646 RepID=A0AAE0VFN0_9BIVA|nr:hypothetical protein CHS0354_018046 [Potamilus streckersoni]